MGSRSAAEKFAPFTSFSLHVHSGFGGKPRQRKTCQSLSPAWSLPRSFLDAGIVILLYPFTASPVQLLNGKSQATVLLSWLGLLHCSFVSLECMQHSRWVLSLC
ncbi:hypothetical protein Nmel_014445 [Mimus melanotis]